MKKVTALTLGIIFINNGFGFCPANAVSHHKQQCNQSMSAINFVRFPGNPIGVMGPGRSV